MNRVEAALRETTERLAQELAGPTQRAPTWSALEWDVARAVVAMHGVGSLLARRLRWTGPPGFRGFLEQQFEATQLRHVRIEDLQRALDGTAQAHGFAAVALKGAALHALGIYAPGERPMADIDLLVRPDAVIKARHAIEGLGYRELHVSWKERAFGPERSCKPQRLGEGACNDIKIELHERICEKLPLRVTDITSHVWPGAAAADAGVQHYEYYAALLLHLVLHAAGSMAFQALRLLHLNDIAAVSRRMSSSQWRALLATPASLWWAYPPLSLTARYFPDSIPPTVLQVLGAQTPSRLRRAADSKQLTDVSYSQLWVDALPGGEWCRDELERVQYFAQRVWPTPEQRALRAMGSETQAWAQVNGWNSMRHVRRLLHWLTQRQARAPTLHALTSSGISP